MSVGINVFSSVFLRRRLTLRSPGGETEVSPPTRVMEVRNSKWAISVEPFQDSITHPGDDGKFAASMMFLCLCARVCVCVFA